MARHDPTNRILQLALVMVALVAVPTSGQVQTKTITATATVTDDFGGTVSCTSSIRVSTIDRSNAPILTADL